MGLLLNPQLLLGIALAVLIAFGAGYVDGRLDGKKIEAAKCANDSLQASRVAGDAERELQLQVRELAREAAIARDLKAPLVQNFIQGVARETPTVPAGVCDWPPALVRRLNAAAEGRFVPDIGGGAASVPPAGVPPRGRDGGIQVESARAVR